MNNKTAKDVGFNKKEKGVLIFAVGFAGFLLFNVLVIAPCQRGVEYVNAEQCNEYCIGWCEEACPDFYKYLAHEICERCHCKCEAEESCWETGWEDRS